MISADPALKQTPLHQEHVFLQAKMVPFGGWDMPLQYEEGILAEYAQTRQKVSVFDTSHMGEFILEGNPREIGLDRLVTQPITDLPVKTCRYGMMLNAQGGVLDDLIVFRLEEKKWLMVVNAGTMEKDAAHILEHLTDRACFKNISALTGKLDVQGPASRDLLTPLIPSIGRLTYFGFDTFDVLGEQVVVSRTGYTGELGYEIFYPWEKTAHLWQTLLDNGARPAGLGVRDVLRLEMGYSLYGHELAEDFSPLEAGLGRFIDWNKDFIGREVLQGEKESGPRRRSIGLISRSRRSPRAGHTIFSTDKRPVGTVTSGTFSPSLNAGIGLALVEREFLPDGGEILFGDDKNTFPADSSRPPFYRQGTLKK